jgi:hypothetical protein
MVDLTLEKPVRIEEATQTVSSAGLMTLATFLLSAGIWHLRLDKKSQNDDQPILLNEDLQELGLPQWHLADGEPSQRFDIRFPEIQIVSPDGERSFHRELGNLIWAAVKTQKSSDLAKALAFGTVSPDPLVRICSLISGHEMLSPTTELHRRLFEFDFSSEVTASTLATILMSRTLSAGMSAIGSAPPITPPKKNGDGIFLIHGTNFPPHRPVWSVPLTGPLFNYIANIRADIYAKPDYFRWEGGYSDYAREVAAQNLDNWMQVRKLNGIDVVTHSHGGNVLMNATYHSVKIGKAILLSCPVRWAHYQVCPGTIKKIDSIRVHSDLVIMADRAGQSFPIGSGIKDTVLPLWYNHSATTDPDVWQKHSLDRFVI